MDFRDISERRDKGPRLTDLPGIIIHARNDGDADNHLLLHLCKPSEITEDHTVRDACELSVFHIVQHLEIKEEKVDRLAHTRQDFGRGHSCGVDDCVDAFLFTGFQKRTEEFVLKQRFAA